MTEKLDKNGWLPINKFDPENPPFLAFLWDGSSVRLAYYYQLVGKWISDDDHEDVITPIKYIPIEFPDPPEKS